MTSTSSNYRSRQRQLLADLEEGNLDVEARYATKTVSIEDVGNMLILLKYRHNLTEAVTGDLIYYTSFVYSLIN
ncbi:unnamed protein product [Didymodactylos carnosus]|uniref:Uncharacterized protein n=1 Tax=Didymodactylos carnosus TaxID=1234261 RepID=A0A8S2R557_9BILA|nr:unnamed protein product [Didymodactylos carnosus]CAF4149237.1 unnamed protein product [Didymodactylos carnosus]